MGVYFMEGISHVIIDIGADPRECISAVNDDKINLELTWQVIHSFILHINPLKEVLRRRKSDLWHNLPTSLFDFKKADTNSGVCEIGLLAGSVNAFLHKWFESSDCEKIIKSLDNSLGSRAFWGNHEALYAMNSILLKNVVFLPE